MINSQIYKNIKKTVEDFFEKAGFKIEIKTLSPENKTLYLKIKTDEPKVLIGQKGQTLSEIQRLLRAILSRQISDTFYLDLDINDYKRKKIDYLKEMAKELADEVALTKKEKILASMPAYERRIIHLELADRKDITTESIGQEPERRVVIKPYP